MWFVPKGFASVVYGLLVLESGITAADEVFHLVALTVVLSILAHSSTDVLVARLFDRPGETPAWWDRRRPDSAPGDPDAGGPDAGGPEPRQPG
jgi:hypothetical protein